MKFEVGDKVRLYGFQCPRCFLRSGDAIQGTLSAAQEAAPSCCEGEKMIPVVVESELEPVEERE